MRNKLQEFVTVNAEVMSAVFHKICYGISLNSIRKYRIDAIFDFLKLTKTSSDGMLQMRIP